MSRSGSKNIKFAIIHPSNETNWTDLQFDENQQKITKDSFIYPHRHSARAH